MLAGRDPIPLGSRVDLEDVSPGAEDWLFPEGGNRSSVGGWSLTARSDLSR